MGGGRGRRHGGNDRTGAKHQPGNETEEREQRSSLEFVCTVINDGTIQHRVNTHKSRSFSGLRIWRQISTRSMYRFLHSNKRREESNFEVSGDEKGVAQKE